MNEDKQATDVHAAQGDGKQSAWQALKFTLFSISAGIIQLASGELFLSVMNLPYWLGYGISLVLSVLWNFTFNRRYTFRSDMNVPRAMTLVFLYYLVFTPLTTWGGDALVNGGANKHLVFIGTMLLNFVTEFFYQRFVVYRKSIDTNDVAQKAREKAAQEAPARETDPS